ncbi:hypothetical protein [Streptomyces sp. WMMC940]|nr:hypothetical protein [Streptomyces sp. WMMC940]MCZ7458357.1 hypothetical protein [Streptomyces sp. WMMC940]
MSTKQDRIDAEIAAWVADQLAASPEWSAERYTTVRTYLETSEAPLNEAA